MNQGEMGSRESGFLAAAGERNKGEGDDEGIGLGLEKEWGAAGLLIGPGLGPAREGGRPRWAGFPPLSLFSFLKQKQRKRRKRKRW